MLCRSLNCDSDTNEAWQQKIIRNDSDDDAVNDDVDNHNEQGEDDNEAYSNFMRRMINEGL